MGNWIDIDINFLYPSIYMHFWDKISRIVFSLIAVLLSFHIISGVSVVQASVCSGITSPRICNESCSPPKGTNNNEFRCRWNYNTQSCGESAKICITSGGGTGIIGGSGCTKISNNNNCYNCKVEKQGTANHYTCSYLPISGAGCPNGFQTGIVSKSYLGFFSAGTQQFCFDGGPEACGSEQIDFGSHGSKQFISRIGPTACVRTPTKTPTVRPIRSPTPTVRPTRIPTLTQAPSPEPPLICQQMKEFIGSVNITNNLDSIKLGDEVTFTASVNNTGKAVKSMTFQFIKDSIVVEKPVVPAVLVGSQWKARYKRIIDSYGSYRVRVARVTPL
ncbi:MAG: hypothetical protein UR68_C0038G0010 [Candidatus Roizmanbacteria bacterium GW2011_GWA2_35_19]|uniref:Uncharacterized protein n=2 Tax=Candidatus Roizmaniibacteriota TaxID=1752723 RepID=A0A0G0BN05_9BACT|nr:MAG: hypothetical protein UR63_C0004G0035 [Candidatus Roizmanbacteria bacterium GW2011_GWC2_35_12]KKP70823.1 MAG: hypothetical protein UR68_C0038G0010 [Candidatus Roizmanbacteria bacterium GW2011_GWA2_35_19]